MSDADGTCDGVDDDCDRRIDEGLRAPAHSADRAPVARPARAAASKCGERQLRAPAPDDDVDANCDGVDDDCEGLVDRDFVGESTACGVDACGATAAPAASVAWCRTAARRRCRPPTTSPRLPQGTAAGASGRCNAGGDGHAILSFSLSFSR